MGRFTVTPAVSSKLVSASVGASMPALTQLDQGWPIGDLLYKWLNFRYFATLAYSAGNGSPTSVTNGALRFLRNFYFGTDLHGAIVDNIAGLPLYRMLCAKLGAMGLQSPTVTSPTVGSSTAVDLTLPIPFFDSELARKTDLALDLLRAQPILRAQFGVMADIGATTGTGTVTCDNVYARAWVNSDPGPISKERQKDGSIKTDEPIMMPYWFTKPVSVTATTPQMPIDLPYGDRIYKRIFIWQILMATGVELADTVINVNETDIIGLKLNGYDLMPAMYQKDLVRQNVLSYNGVTRQTVGNPLIIDLEHDRFSRRGHGATMSDMLSVVSANNGTLRLYVDVTAPDANSGLLIGAECAKPLPVAAQSIRPVREIQAASPAA